MNDKLRDVVAVVLVTLFGIPMGLYLAYRAVKEGLGSADAEAMADERMPDSYQAELEQRVAELEERLDFTERMLAEQAELREVGSGE